MGIVKKNEWCHHNLIIYLSQKFSRNSIGPVFVKRPDDDVIVQSNFLSVLEAKIAAGKCNRCCFGEPRKCDFGI